MFGLNKFFKGNDGSENQEQQGPDPLKIRALLEDHPAFQILTVDGLKWIDPHTLTLIDCPFGYLDTALDWLLEEQPWKQHKCRHPKEVRMMRWRIHLAEHIDLEPRFKIFDKHGHWLNPFLGCTEERAQLADGKISRETLTQMARSLIEYDEEQLKDLKSRDELADILNDINGFKQETEKIIRATDRFEVHKQAADAGLPSETPDDSLHLENDPDATLVTDLHHQPQVDSEATIDTSLNPQPIMSESNATIEIVAAAEDLDVEKTMDVDFSQGSLLETPEPDKPIKEKKTESFKRVKKEPDIGEQIAGYKIVSFLGKGGMGNVHKAIQMSMQREVALKILPPELCRDDTFASRFVREARAAGKVNHPNVITCFDVGNDKGVLYMALELVTGGDVAQLLKRENNRISSKRALRIMQDCARGLGAIHKAGLIHRDIKPANIFLSEDGIAKLADLGLARSSGQTQMTQAGACVGTPAYMSPEQIKGEEDIDIRTDIYALGITLFTLLTGNNPFKAKDVWALFKKVIDDPVPNVCDLDSSIDPQFNTIIQRCLEKNRDDRYHSPIELLEALDEL